MNHRLVGAIILGCLAVIFIPIILDGEGVKVPEVLEDIPPQPSIPEIPIIEATRPVILSDTDGLDLPAAVSTREVERPESGAEIVDLTRQGLPESWLVQLGSFSDVDNANALINSLLQAGYKAFGKPLQTSAQGSLTAVYVGPVLSRQAASGLVVELEEKYALDGIVIEFEIDELPQ